MKIGKVVRAIIAVIFLIVGILQVGNAFTKPDSKESGNQRAIINEFVADENGVEFCVTEVDNVKSVGSDYFEVTTEYNFVVVTIKIVNNGTEPYDVNALRFVLMAGETEYEYASNTVLSLDNSMSMDTINPGIDKEYTIVYETPTTTHDSEFVLKIKPNAFVDDDSVYITLKDTK